MRATESPMCAPEEIRANGEQVCAEAIGMRAEERRMRANESQKRAPEEICAKGEPLRA
ncbi:hypothetical protein [Sporosarcina sp. D27]|uniref:hypothetical protein n=1 Tax=Sporosarcina sp. D27 TaxID=1382305 RepID=UPI0012DED9D6|nr:hypothetical protein [Sporosarcina sp. D27]